MSHAYYKRQFLNNEEHGGVAFVEAQIDEDTRHGIDASITLADCNRQINLDFSAYGEEGAANALLKLRRLRTTFAAFEAVLRAQLDAKVWDKPKGRRVPTHRAETEEPELIRRPE